MWHYHATAASNGMFTKSIHFPLCLFRITTVVVAMNLLGQDAHVEKKNKLIKSSISFGIPQPWARDNAGPAAIKPQKIK